jgi:hypothetical protein
MQLIKVLVIKNLNLKYADKREREYTISQSDVRGSRGRPSVNSSNL